MPTNPFQPNVGSQAASGPAITPTSGRDNLAALYHKHNAANAAHTAAARDARVDAIYTRGNPYASEMQRAAVGVHERLADYHARKAQTVLDHARTLGHDITTGEYRTKYADLYKDATNPATIAALHKAIGYTKWV